MVERNPATHRPQTRPQLGCSSVLVHGSLVQNTHQLCFQNASSSHLLPLRQKRFFPLWCHGPWHLYRARLHVLSCCSGAFLASHLPCPSPAQASPRCSLRTEDLEGSACFLSTSPVRLLYLPATQNHLNSLNHALLYICAIVPVFFQAGMVFCSFSAEKTGCSFSKTTALTAPLVPTLLNQRSLRPSQTTPTVLLGSATSWSWDDVLPVWLFTRFCRSSPSGFTGGSHFSAPPKPCTAT